MADLQGKHLIVIGGSSGIGFAIAQLAGQEGATLTLIGRSQEQFSHRATAGC